MNAPKAVVVALNDPEPVTPAVTEASGFDCDVCGKHFDGEPAGAGLFMWTRGDEVRFEEPPLCEACAENVTLDALTRWEVEEEEEG